MCILLYTTQVRNMFNEEGKPVQKAEPSAAVEVIGWKELPSAGDVFLQAKSEVSVAMTVYRSEMKIRVLPRIFLRSNFLGAEFCILVH